MDGRSRPRRGRGRIDVAINKMTDKTHLDRLLSQVQGDLGARLTEAFKKLVRYAYVAVTTRAVEPHALFIECFQSTDVASG